MRQSDAPHWHDAHDGCPVSGEISVMAMSMGGPLGDWWRGVGGSARHVNASAARSAHAVPPRTTVAPAPATAPQRRKMRMNKRVGGGHPREDMPGGGQACAARCEQCVYPSSFVSCMRGVPRSNRLPGQNSSMGRRWDPARGRGAGATGADAPVGIPRADTFVGVPSRTPRSLRVTTPPEQTRCDWMTKNGLSLALSAQAARPSQAEWQAM